ERDELSEGNPASDDFTAPEPEHQQRAESEKKRHAREKESLEHDQAAVSTQILFVRLAESIELRRFLPIRANDAHARQRFLGDGAHVRKLGLDLLEPLVNLAAEVFHRD